MNVCILMGSPRKNGNTQALLRPFTGELKATGCTCRTPSGSPSAIPTVKTK